SSEFTRLPAGSMMVGVTNMTRFFFVVLEDSLRKSRPINGRSPNTGTLSLTLVDVSPSRPPRTMVWPSQTMALVTTWRRRKMGNGVVVERVVAPGDEDWTCGEKSRAD